MSRFVVQCTIDRTKLNLLSEMRRLHYAFLIEHQREIVFGGPTRTDPQGPPETMIIIIEVIDQEAAEKFIADEPYHSHGGFSRVTIRPWTQVLPETYMGALRETYDNIPT